ncbi:hypothetical protein SeMB42_g01795 [Synchytrium endobioticum]|uniref:Uncharacterized protein n=1 Tax=Synchytrium endobioticum TaxID=286115 RepID=A0A507DJK8_9FUNG|nr:hypothetical protein SeMB42_g01795 [Synchytrium endobioticum]
MAQYILEIFDAYEEAAGELHGGNRLASTWEGIIRKDAYKYITAVKSALANIENFYVPPADVDLSAHIQYVDGIPPGINLLISAYPVPENLPPDYLELATKLHFLVVDRLHRANNRVDRLDALIGERWQLFSAYNQVAGVFPDMRTISWGNTGGLVASMLSQTASAPTVLGAQRDILDPATSTYPGPYGSIESGSGTRSRAVSGGSSSSGGAQRNILDATTSTYTDPHDYTESRLGTRTRANFEGSSSPGGSQNKRNGYAGG